MSNRAKLQAALHLEGLVAANTRASIGAWITFTESLAVDAEGCVCFSDIKNDRILKRTLANGVSVFRADSGRISIPEDLTTDPAFGDPDKKTLYGTAGKALFAVHTSVSGFTIYLPLRG